MKKERVCFTITVGDGSLSQTELEDYVAQVHAARRARLAACDRTDPEEMLLNFLLLDEDTFDGM